jgi:uncharacterized protein (TIGR02145 family)
MTKVKIYLLAVVCVLFLSGSCKKDDDNKATIAVLTTNEISDVTLNSATTGGNISSDGGAIITARGVCWSCDPNPISANNKTIDGKGTGNFISTITCLKANTTYYIWAYATNSVGTAYGNVRSFSTEQYISDIDGNIYDAIQIGSQIWMKQNLKVTHYRNGDPIPNISYSATGAYCDYHSCPDTSKTYGRLYNWYAVNDNRNIAPEGWHVASDAEWTILINYLGGENVAGSKLKESGIAHWVKPNSDATNESRFTALPGGSTNTMLGHNGHWWTATTDSNYTENAWYLTMSHLYSNVNRNSYQKNAEYSVRCIKD